ncbi:MAG: arsenite methyltransferase [Flavobacteriales bacterium]
MTNAQETKDMVRRKYAEIAQQDKATNASSCCGAGGCSTEVYNIMSEDYTTLEGYTAGADLGLGCGLPTQYAGIKAGDTVLDLGSGAGNDCFVARAATGVDGRVIGVDFTPEMIAKAKQNAKDLDLQNVEFRLGDIEALPLSACMVDVVVSNCVLNLVPNKEQAMREVLRVLKPGGHFSISDVVLNGELPAKIQEAAEMYAGCVSGALQEEVYLDIIRGLGFEDVTVQQRKPIVVPDDILSNYLSAAEIEAFKASGTGIFSVTVRAQKSAAPCCGPEKMERVAELKATAPTTAKEGDPDLGCCDLGVACC